MIYSFETGEQCYSPSGSYGTCVVLPQCPSLIKYYGQNQGNRQVINYLLAAQRNCGTRRIGDNPIVCCDNPVINRPVPTQNPYHTQLQPATTQNSYQPQPEFPPEEPVPQTPVTQRAKPPPTRLTTPQTITTTTTVAPTNATDSRNAGESCTDPNGVKGTCTNINECPSVLNEFIARSKDQRYIRFIKLSNIICDNIQASICCPFEEENEVPIKPIEPIERNQTRNGNSIQGRLLTPEEGCGYSKNAGSRIVGGVTAQLGEIIINYLF